MTWNIFILVYIAKLKTGLRRNHAVSSSFYIIEIFKNGCSISVLSKIKLLGANPAWNSNVTSNSLSIDSKLAKLLTFGSMYRSEYHSDAVGSRPWKKAAKAQCTDSILLKYYRVDNQMRRFNSRLDSMLRSECWNAAPDYWRTNEQCRCNRRCIIENEIIILLWCRKSGFEWYKMNDIFALGGNWRSRFYHSPRCKDSFFLMQNRQKKDRS